MKIKSIKLCFTLIIQALISAKNANKQTYKDEWPIRVRYTVMQKPRNPNNQSILSPINSIEKRHVAIGKVAKYLLMWKFPKNTEV